jgi:hypothetical protein
MSPPLPTGRITLASRRRLVSVGLPNELFVPIYKIPSPYIYIYIYIYVISELHSVEGQWNLSAHVQKERFWFKRSSQRRVFAGCHLEAGQCVTKCGLHLHQSEPHSCKENKKEQFSRSPK